MDALDLTPEQYGKMKACKTPEEIAELAKTEGIPLTDEQLEAVAGGESDWDAPAPPCPYCGSTNTVEVVNYTVSSNYVCHDCKREFK